ncbi:hypothetical protein [Granulicella sibirica]|uniref:Uncharacterized protein n=1 Tax=Granulicella sibirica TaxID=2479048 RepID=A0A4Q0SSB9_9BACT|nr:hypothetical protein [Granulicella sibirica]RXH53805.1 hypothetical protein GRAN_5143 [Granulicella sibirica]
MKVRETIERPSAVVDVTGLSCAITEREDGSILIGAAAKKYRRGRAPIDPDSLPAAVLWP